MNSKKRNDNESASVMSPLLTAQERKRKILERRRQRQKEAAAAAAQEEATSPMFGAATYSTSMHSRSSNTTNTVPFTCNNSIDNNSTSAFASLKRKKRRVESNTNSTSSNHDYATSAAAASSSAFSKLAQQQNDLTMTPEDKRRRSTLFGAVMQRTTTSSTTTTPTKPPPVFLADKTDDMTTPSDTTATAAASTTTPLAKNNQHGRALTAESSAAVSWKDHAAGLSTPQSSSSASSSSSRSKSFLTANSPCGFALRKVLESVVSPFRGVHHHNTTSSSVDKNEEDDNDHNQEQTSPAAVLPEDMETTSATAAADKPIEEWQEGSLCLDDNAIRIVDWSIKRKLRLECHPASCLPTDASSTDNDWQSAMTYWQHPAMHPLPPSMISIEPGNNNDTTTTSDHTLQSQSSLSTKEVSAFLPSLSSLQYLSEMVRGKDALLHRLVAVTAARPSHDDDATLLWKQRRNRQWQESFRSLYYNWMAKVEKLQGQSWDETNRKDALSQAAIARRLYFYAMAPGQTILFRVAISTTPAASSEKETDKGNGPSTSTTLVPMVVLSSTNHILRSKLRAMGVKLLYHHDRTKAFEESVFEAPKPEKKVTQDETEAVHQELEALRRAQAHGETAGADVSIATKTRAKSTQRIRPRSIPPLCLVGQDDCASFFEFYLNTMGGSSKSWRRWNGDVPLLLSRNHVGPFMHASLQSLSVASRRGANGPQGGRDLNDGMSSNDHHHHATIELRGPILPCAMGELVCAAASRMMQDTTENQGQQPSRSSKALSHDDDVGSHYFVVQAQTDDGMKERTGGDSTTTGTASTRFLNDGINLFDGQLGEEHDQDHISGCDHGEVVNMIVWDIARPNMIAFKTESRPNI